MHLPSKIKYKFVAAALLLLLFFPFKGVDRDVFIFLYCRQFLPTQNAYIKEIEGLKKENLSLKLQAEKFAKLTEENQELKKALNLKTEKELNLIGAECIGFAPSSWRSFIILNKGRISGIEKGLLAVDTDGNLIGKVSEVNEEFSYLVVVNDPDFNITAFIEDKDFGLLKGGLGGAKILYIENGDDIKIGDKIWAKMPYSESSVGIGTVREIKKNLNSLFWDVDVRLFAKNAFFEKIFIIK